MSTMRLLAALSITGCLLSACAKEPPLPKIEDVLPPNFEVHPVPDDYEAPFGGLHKVPKMWNRCFDCELDWDGMVAFIESNPHLAGYHECTGEWVGAMGIADMPLDMRNEFVYVYSSPETPYLVILTNLAYARNAGMTVGSAGDYIITCGADLFEK